MKRVRGNDVTMFDAVLGTEIGASRDNNIQSIRKGPKFLRNIEEGFPSHNDGVSLALRSGLCESPKNFRDICEL